MNAGGLRDEYCVADAAHEMASPLCNSMRNKVHSLSSSATACKPSTCCEITLTTTMMGTHSSIPHTPQSQAPNSSATNTAMAFILAIRPVIQVATSMPTKVAMVNVTPAASNMAENDSNCRKAAQPMATEARIDPK